jgi:hypothetical protein
MEVVSWNKRVTLISSFKTDTSTTLVEGQESGSTIELVNVIHPESMIFATSLYYLAREPPVLGHDLASKGFK